MKLIFGSIIMTVLLFVSTIFGFTTISYSADRADVIKLIDFAIAQKFDNLNEDEYTIDRFNDIRNPNLKHVTFSIREQLSVLEDYEYNWHYLHIGYYAGNAIRGKPYTLSIVVKEVKDATSPDSRTYTQWSIADYNIDGIQDRYFKKFVIVMENYMGRGYDLKLFPQWPDGIFNHGWFNPPEEEVQAYYDKEIKFWLNELLGVEK